MRVLSTQLASFMSPFWKIGGCILNADILPWQNKSFHCITISAEVFIWNTHFHCPYTKGFLYLDHQMEKSFTCIKISSRDARQQSTEAY